jgi:CubicO group peptidase (beta-lactamase class C family)
MRPLILLLALAACAERATFTTPIPIDGTFAQRTPDGDAQRRYRLAADYSAARNGTAMLVLEGDALVFSEGQNGHAETEPHHLFSGTKSFSCALATVLAEDGTLDLDAPAAKILTEWSGDAKRSKITARQLLSFTSGLGADWWALTRDGLLALPSQRVADKYAHAVALAATHEPGTHYEYGSQHLMAFGALVRRASGRDPLALLDERVFKPIGLRVAGWNVDRAGNAMLPYGAWLTAHEWAKFGALVRDRGAWRGRQVLPEARLAECLRGSATFPGYGLTWWLNTPVSEEKLAGADTPVKRTDGVGGPLFYAKGADDLVVAAGFHDQRMYVLPSRKLVVVRLGDGDRDWRDAAFLARLLDGVERE